MVWLAAPALFVALRAALFVASRGVKLGKGIEGRFVLILGPVFVTPAAAFLKLVLNPVNRALGAGSGMVGFTGGGATEPGSMGCSDGAAGVTPGAGGFAGGVSWARALVTKRQAPRTRLGNFRNWGEAFISVSGASSWIAHWC